MFNYPPPATAQQSYGDAPPTSGGVPPTSADSVQSADSGICDPDDDYSFVITENSAPELVKQVEDHFKLVNNLGAY